jgi:N4-gp56 family major capsid protein
MTTVIPWGSKQAVKVWSTALATDIKINSYFDNRFIGEGDNNVIEVKNDLNKQPGLLIQFDLAASLWGKPTTGDNVVEGRGDSLRFFEDEVRIDQVRHEVDCGGRMTRQATVHDLRAIGRRKLGEYWARYFDELRFIYLSGARGINGEFIEDTAWTGHAFNPIQAPDAAHIFRSGWRTSSAAITTGDIMTRDFVEGVNSLVRMIRADKKGAADMVPVMIEGEKRYAIVMSPWQEHSMRVSDTTGWLAIQRDLTTAVGKSSPLFKGGLGMIGNTVLHSHENVIRFNNYGAGANLPAARALLFARQAGVEAYGSNSGRNRFDWMEETADRGNRKIVTAGTVIGFKKTRFVNQADSGAAADFGVCALDTYAKAPNA